MLNTLLKHIAFKPLRRRRYKRKHERRAKDHCVIEMKGQNFPVRDWSYGGVLVTADERMFALQQDAEFKLKFRLQGEVHTIAHRGHIVRKTKDAIALQFEPLTRDLRQSFQSVVESAVA